MANDNSDPVLDIFMKLYANMLSRGNPWIAVEMDGSFYYLGDLYDLLKKKSVDNLVKSIMECWSEWIKDFQLDENEEVQMESISFEDPMVDIFYQLAWSIHDSGNPWMGIEMDGAIFSLPDLYDLMNRKSIDEAIKSTMDSWSNWIKNFPEEETIMVETLSFI